MRRLQAEQEEREGWKRYAENRAKSLISKAQQVSSQRHKPKRSSLVEGRMKGELTPWQGERRGCTCDKS